MLTMFKKTIAFATVVAVLLSFQGCVRDRDEAEKTILAHDPSFQKTIDKRKQLRKQMNSHENVYLVLKQNISAQIMALKEKREKAKKDYLDSVEKLKGQMHPEKRELERGLAETERNYRLKGAELGIINRDMKEVDALIKKKDELTLTPEETKTWNDRLAALIRRKAEVSAEKAKLGKEIQITKLKISVLNP
jgi:hypothetical protein